MPRLTRVFAAFAVAGLTSLTLTVPAVAAPPATGCKPEAGKPAYPPGQCKKPSFTGSSTPGGHATAYSGEGQFDKGSQTQTEVHSVVFVTGARLVDSKGAATLNFTIPASITAGAHTVVFKGTFFGQPRTVSVPFTVELSGGTTSNVGTGSNASGGSTSGVGSGLPLTGFELGAASLLGLGLVGAGAAAVVSGRKKKSLVVA